MVSGIHWGFGMCALQKSGDCCAHMALKGKKRRDKVDVGESPEGVGDRLGGRAWSFCSCGEASPPPTPSPQQKGAVTDAVGLLGANRLRGAPRCPSDQHRDLAGQVDRTLSGEESRCQGGQRTARWLSVQHKLLLMSPPLQGMMGSQRPELAAAGQLGVARQGLGVWKGAAICPWPSAGGFLPLQGSGQWLPCPDRSRGEAGS